ncbi:hypothetical protein [Cereibacter sphaeroides]|jgi:hypothetical protein|uniref:hypothetical protein n=1 Tax=Cereibacter sphaeroides TaxID=1063 RepID=UPI0000F29EBC|nr:hypothetical protein Rsph17029_0649 [Cereibacter sphaeroides ATCC 17029]
MTPFYLFQTATCLIAEGNRTEAAEIIERAIQTIDRTGKDTYMRGDLEKLHRSLKK